ncbi:DUF5034 domain-containing protein [Mangrovivirga cuniculi]|uniref:Uncharacterized protein n=1 Tax=Mangrovivirga cuniculi TaxID=2715131 RepID=A0A4D7K1M9_9BACT|nr:DUF5034 domain-containing protein [Mangrovivirga cuniculi]QCK16855.1 hypothetical protein DCC35_20010 [Mangrovivirga cuniculi]
MISNSSIQKATGAGFEQYQDTDTLDAVYEFVLMQSLDLNVNFLSEATSYGLFSTTAYACSPLVSYSLMDSVKSVVITSDNDFNSEYPAGTNLVGLFNMLDIGSERIPFSADNLNNAYFLDNFQKDPLTLYITKAPGEASKHVFTIEIETSSKTLSSTTDEVILE